MDEKYSIIEYQFLTLKNVQSFMWIAVETKFHMAFFHEQIELRVAHSMTSGKI